MYSYEDRIRAVELYIKLGKRAGATIRQLGYPTKNSLKSWHRDYELRQDLSHGYVRLKPKYSQSQKEQAVEHYLKHGRCIVATIKALGYQGRDSLRGWIGELHPELHTRVVSRFSGSTRPPAVKKAALIALCMRQDSAAAVAQELGVCRPNVVRLEKSTAWPRHTRIHETTTRNAASPQSWSERSNRFDATSTGCSLSTTC